MPPSRAPANQRVNFWTRQPEAWERLLGLLMAHQGRFPPWSAWALLLSREFGEPVTESLIRKKATRSPEWAAWLRGERAPAAAAVAEVDAAPFALDKRYAGLHWREINRPLKQLQKLLHDASGSQDTATLDFSHLDRPICVAAFSDFHMGSWGTDYETLERVTDELLSIPDLYGAALGDFLQMSIKLRSVLEVSDNALPPGAQDAYLESWLEEVYEKFLFATWDNHSVMRQEAQAGFSSYSRIWKRRCVYHNGIGHVSVLVGSQRYEIAASHVFRGRSMYNPVHGQMRYARMEANDREIVMAGDSHVPGLSDYPEGGMWRTALNGGSLQVNSGYGKRFFSLTTWPIFPCVELYPDEHMVIPYRSIRHWMKATGRLPLAQSDEERAG